MMIKKLIIANITEYHIPHHDSSEVFVFYV